MDKTIVDKLLQLREGNKIKINNKLFTILKKSFHEAPNKFEKEITSFELENDFVLEFNGGYPSFFQIVKKKGFFGFTSTRSRYENIDSVEILD